MKHLMIQDEIYPFVFFPEEGFYQGQVVNYIVNAYCEFQESESIVTPQEISHHAIDLILLGQIGRIVKLGEDYTDLFTPPEFNREVRDMAEYYNGDLIRVMNELAARNVMVGIDRDTIQLLEQDIRTVLNKEKMFYFDNDVPYSSLRYFSRTDEMSPFSDESINEKLRNIPITRVW